MAKIYAKPVENQLAGIGGALALGDASRLGGKVHMKVKSVNFADQAQITTSDSIEWFNLPKGAVPLFGILDASASLGSSTIDVGTDVTAAKFRAAATFTATDTPTMFMKAAAKGVPLTDKAAVRSLIASASLPTTGILTLALFYTTPHGG